MGHFCVPKIRTRRLRLARHALSDVLAGFYCTYMQASVGKAKIRAYFHCSASLRTGRQADRQDVRQTGTQTGGQASRLAELRKAWGWALMTPRSPSGFGQRSHFLPCRSLLGVRAPWVVLGRFLGVPGPTQGPARWAGGWAGASWGTSVTRYVGHPPATPCHGLAWVGLAWPG